MRDVVVVSYARTGLAKSVRGGFNNTHGAAMAGHVIQHAMERARLDPAEVEDVVLGVAQPEGATGHNVARNAAICPSARSSRTGGNGRIRTTRMVSTPTASAMSISHTES